MREYNLFETPLSIRGLFILMSTASALIVYVLLFHLKFEFNTRIEATINKRGNAIVMSNSIYPLNKVSKSDIEILGINNSNVDSFAVNNNGVMLYLNEVEEKPFLNQKDHYLLVKQHKSVFKILRN